MFSLLESGLVAEVADVAGAKDKDPRRGVSYRLTASGKRALVAERTRLVELLRGFDTFRPAEKRGRS